MTDKELLELAAKAYGIEIYESTDGTLQNRPIWAYSCGGGMGTMPHEERWNPLENDAQAFRLAVKLSMKVYAGEAYPWDEDVCNYSRSFSACVDQDEEPEPYAATRRAIVRSAAIIGSKQ